MVCFDLVPTDDCPASPYPIEGLPEPAIQVSTSEDTTCVVLESGRAMCWGDNLFGALGNGTTEDSEIPVDVVGLEGVKLENISVGGGNVCAIDTDGRVYCWGDNRMGQVGNGVLADLETGENNEVLTPTEVVGLPEPMVAISARGSHACAVAASGAIYCWGDNFNGQLGNGQDVMEECHPDFNSCRNP
ncbi:MAG: hypothetical protein PHU25_21565, partial [Deltaproteobacteria bacterium]|nr:hypothetical protein [Deltaproteobacteria bacterium]